MKKTISLLVITFFLLCGITCTSPSKAFANGEGTDAIHNIFIDTLYGMAIGFALGAAFSAAQGEDGSELAENIGAGAAIGGILGAAYGIAFEVRSVAEIRNNKICLQVPSLALTSNANAGGVMLHTNLVKFHF